MPGPLQQDHDRLSRIHTMWTVVRQAHDASDESLRQAQGQLLERYSGAVHRYLMAITRDADQADEMFQEFALRVMKGAFRHADPGRGRFRDYLKTAVIRMAREHRRKQVRRPGQIEDEHLAVIPGDETSVGDEVDAQFDASWRDDLLYRAWKGLEEWERDSGQPYFAVLRLRTEKPDAKSDELATLLSARTGAAKPYNAPHVRKLLQRAREHFASLLVDEVKVSLGPSTDQQLEDELVALGLHGYCRSALKKACTG